MPTHVAAGIIAHLPVGTLHYYSRASQTKRRKNTRPAKSPSSSARRHGANPHNPKRAGGRLPPTSSRGDVLGSLPATSLAARLGIPAVRSRPPGDGGECRFLQLSLASAAPWRRLCFIVVGCGLRGLAVSAISAADLLGLGRESPLGG